MVSGTTLSRLQPARVMLVGYPGSGKTGSIACLANAGFKLRILDYDGNLEPLLQHTTSDGLARIDVISLEDKLRLGAKFIETEGLPTAFIDGFKALDRWKYVDPETGEEFDLGASRDWGLDTVVVLDGLTAMGVSSLRRSQKMLNKTPLDTSDRVWGLAMAEQEAFIERLTATRNRHHVIATAHLKMIGPKDLRKGDTEMTKELKERTVELVRTRLYPSALGQVLPPVIGGHFPTLLLVEPKYRGGKASRVLRSVPRPELDLKVPAPDLPEELDISDGLLQVFDAVTGGVENCLKAEHPVPSEEKKETEGE